MRFLYAEDLSSAEYSRVIILKYRVLTCKCHKCAGVYLVRISCSRHCVPFLSRELGVRIPLRTGYLCAYIVIVPYIVYIVSYIVSCKLFKDFLYKLYEEN